MCIVCGDFEQTSPEHLSSEVELLNNNELTSMIGYVSRQLKNFAQQLADEKTIKNVRRTLLALLAEKSMRNESGVFKAEQ